MNYQELCNVYQVFCENFRNRVELVIFSLLEVVSYRLLWNCSLQKYLILEENYSGKNQQLFRYSEISSLKI